VAVCCRDAPAGRGRGPGVPAVAGSCGHACWSRALSFWSPGWP